MQDSFVLKDGTVIPKKKGKVGWAGLIFSIIPLIGFVLFSLVPICVSIFLSFTDVSTFQEIESATFVGLRNFFEVLRDGKFWHSVGVAFYATLGQFVSLSIALMISLLLGTKVKGWNVFSVLYFIPYITSSVAISMIWKRMFATQNGLINELFTIFGYTGEKIEWLDTGEIYMIIFIFIQAWHAPGYGILMFNAAFSSVDNSLYEAARIDGANRFKQFTSITFPTISPTIHFLAMLGVINGLQQFEMFQVFTGIGGSWTAGFGPDDMGLVPLLYIYNLGVPGGRPGNRMGYASAMSWVMFFVVFATSKLLNEKLAKAWVASEYE
jgi:multiple sugar transport system permease protein